MPETVPADFLGYAHPSQSWAKVVHGSSDDVVDKALNYVFATDRDFQEYLKSSQSEKVAPSLRVRRAGAEPIANGKAPVVGVETRRESTPKASLVPEDARSVQLTTFPKRPIMAHE